MEKEKVQEIITKELVDVASSSQCRLEYNELSKVLEMKYDLVVNEHFGLKHYFDKIGRECHAKGLPLLSAMVVNKQTQKPSEGFFKLYDELNGTHVTGNPVFEKKCLDEVRKEILDCKDWDLLVK